MHSINASYFLSFTFCHCVSMQISCMLEVGHLSIFKLRNPFHLQLSRQAAVLERGVYFTISHLYSLNFTFCLCVHSDFEVAFAILMALFTTLSRAQLLRQHCEKLASMGLHFMSIPMCRCRARAEHWCISRHPLKYRASRRCALVRGHSLRCAVDQRRTARKRNEFRARIHGQSAHL